MADVMSQETYEKLIAKLEANPMYRSSKSLRKDWQFRQFYGLECELIQGKQVRLEDAAGNVEGEEGFDGTSAREVIYRFTDGVLHSENGEPAIQYESHWEYWDLGLIKEVVADDGDTLEFWENGVPLRVETDVKRRLQNGEEI